MRIREILLLLLVTTSLAGCEAIATIFEVGFWTGVVLVLIVLAVLGFIFSKLRR